MAAGERWFRAHLFALLALGFATGWANSSLSPAAGILLMLVGSHRAGTSFLALSLHLLVFVGAAVVTHAAFTDRLSGSIYHELLRVQTMRRWLARWAVRSVLHSAASVAALVIGVIVAHALTSSLYDQETMWSGLGYALFFALVVGAAQGSFYWSMMAAVTVVSGRIQAALPVIGFIIVFLFPMMRGSWSPIGAASAPAGPLSMGPVAGPLIPLVLGCAVTAIVCWVASTRRDVEFV